MKRQSIVIALAAAAALASAGFAAGYALRAPHAFEGLCVAGAAAFLALALAAYLAWILPREQVIDEREPLAGDPVVIPRASAVARCLAAAFAVFGIAALVPLLSLKRSKATLLYTRWRRGSRMRREDGTLVRASDLNPDGIVTVFPEDALDDPQSQALLIRLPAASQVGVGGYVAFSKICTHAGCPVALYRARAKQLLCPCHQSVFDVLHGGRVVSGPADHALPELPLEIGDDGFVRAAGDFPVPVGPGFWGRP